jgi:hypothetical protein
MLRATSLTTAAITGGTGVPVILGEAAIPVISVSSGSMGNNGALTAITALPRTIANCYMLFPAGAIAAGVPAAATFYFVQMSSTTAGTVFNNTYSGTGIPTIPASPTAFATTGPGAFTGNTTEVGVLITIPANGMKLNGSVRAATQFGHTNSAGGKAERIRFGGIAGTQIVGNTPTTTVGSFATATVTNCGVQNSQTGYGAFYNNNTVAAIGVSVASSVTTNADTTIAFTVAPAVATDNAWIESFAVELLTYST